ncbi:MAG: putative flavoprotein involved in transport [Pseudonocardiales bacterium]|nr:putative flavoprotein involved in transport [Pseudonocardiales bacterium]
MQCQTIVIGAGQAGLSAGFHLAKRGQEFVILDAADRIGGSWLNRWDSMKLFTPATHDGLPGLPFPGGYGFPTREEMTAYLASYAERFALPVRTGVHVDGLFREGEGFRVTAGSTAYDAQNVVLATGVHRRPRIPDFADQLAKDIVQLHSCDYRNPAQLRPGTVLLVGAGNSAADIGLELAPAHRTLMSGRHPGHLPIDINSRQARMLFPFIWFTWTHVLTEKTRPGRKLQAQIRQGHGDMLIRVKPQQIDDAGIERTPRIAGVENGRPQTEDGVVLDVANVIWCTGFVPDFGWIDLPGLDSSGHLSTYRGRVTGQPGLYMLGQEFQYMFNSHTVGGVGRDAAFVVNDIAKRSKTLPPQLAATARAGGAELV